jgi:uncharacterized protein YbjT (DUF2867 family)
MAQAEPMDKGHESAGESDDAFLGTGVLVTGATGFVGLSLADALLGLGAGLAGAALSDNGKHVPRRPQLIRVDIAEPD